MAFCQYSGIAFPFIVFYNLKHHLRGSLSADWGVGESADGDDIFP